jgi:hypothetical protein
MLRVTVNSPKGEKLPVQYSYSDSRNVSFPKNYSESRATATTGLPPTAGTLATAGKPTTAGRQ